MACLGLVACAGGESQTAPETRALVMKLDDSGSTNTPGWQVSVYSDGSGQLTSATRTPLPGRAKLQRRTFAPRTFDAKRLNYDLNHANLPAIRGHCLRSISFGSVETLTHDSKTVVGIDCYIDAGRTRLARELNTVLARVVPPGR